MATDVATAANQKQRTFENVRTAKIKIVEQRTSGTDTCLLSILHSLWGKACFNPVGLRRLLVFLYHCSAFPRTSISASTFQDYRRKFRTALETSAAGGAPGETRSVSSLVADKGMNQWVPKSVVALADDVKPQLETTTLLEVLIGSNVLSHIIESNTASDALASLPVELSSLET